MDRLKINELIWQAVASIPKGKVVTYGQIAKLSGYPGLARYVGLTLKNLPSNTTLPWHRVINAKGEISFPQGSPEYKRQKALLKAEGVIFNKAKLPAGIYDWL
ncbi:MAG: cysteine methyltransferase [Methylophaga sp.]|nr:MAG: cysteine methyltransferase [Methylophaga sp.]